MTVTLLALAMQLLIAAQKPNLPIELRNQAINLASEIVVYSQQPEVGAVQDAPEVDEPHQALINDGCGYKTMRNGITREWSCI